MIKIGEGETAEVYRTDDGKVLKLIKEDMYEEKFFNIEYMAAKFMGDNTKIAPMVYGEIVNDSRHGYLMEEIKGHLFQSVIDNNSENLINYGRMLGENHRKVHDLKLSNDLLQLDRTKDFLKYSLSKNNSLPKEVCNWLIEILEELSDELSLLHGDFMPYNIMIQNDELKILDWAEPSLGPASIDIARTINFIIDTTDYPDSVITASSDEFVEAYLLGYYSDEKVPKDQIHKAFLINAASEIRYADYIGESDEYSDFLKDFILDNFNSKDNKYIKALKRI